MSFLAKFIVDGNEFDIMEFDIHFNQKADNMGKPEQIPHGGNFRVVIEADRKTDFLGWMLSDSETKDGSVIFYRRDTMSRMRDMKFSKAFCIDYKESFRNITDMPMKIEMIITSKKLDFSGLEYDRGWIL